MIYKLTEWQNSSGIWYCNCIDNLAQNSGAWWLPARVLNISPADFIKLLLSKYKPDVFSFNKEKCFCCWGWKDQSAMRKFKNELNAEARKVNFQI